ncbi:hypothetical protein DICPUDRAFT_158574 [Dictyostelium purpureum]|uniref:Uncharacterized protein n=1 Tax=Dictyostelium purpureum TaxID=5786 RepID=F1A1X8_DICPU|nr:uncharacterized protein DICPUDRAFT_158574 [Dictyostelium purpureum]EGC29804.1 hypothetical protein DICPUDRAFT_158574 [Dictyostelium purpureum]|eukprot:XP_003293669.1 hypothetical protein DICPUDRAFT_158574 [Dictyostelium purpureum]
MFLFQILHLKAHSINHQHHLGISIPIILEKGLIQDSHLKAHNSPPLPPPQSFNGTTIIVFTE